MPRAKRRWDAIEIHAERGLSFGFTAICTLGLSWLLWAYRGQGTLVGLAGVLFVAGLVFLGMAVQRAIEIRKITSHSVLCPICDFDNELTEPPTGDFVCQNCQRIIPIQDGLPMEVKRVRCKHCGEVNHYSEKTEFLICEVCNHEVEIDTEASRKSTGKPVAKAFVVTDDDNLYEFILVAHGPKTDGLIDTLQSLLALNRNQVKQMLDELPITILTGITRRKAEILQAQLAIHEAASEYKPMAPV